MKVVADQAIPLIKAYLQHKVELHLKPGRAITPADVKDADILLVRSVTRVDEALLKGTRIKYVGSVTTGHDHLDIAWLNRQHIKWGTAAGFNVPPVGDYLVSIIAALKQQNIMTQTHLKVAVIGVGRVGRLVVRYLKELGFDVIMCDPIRARNEKEFVSKPLDEIADVDLITLHVPLTHEDFPTYHAINEKFLRRQKKGCVLVNTSRGAVIDSLALMQSGTHLHWCLDVFEHEPDINQALLQCALIATPHIAGYSVQSKLRGVAMIYNQLCDLGLVKNDNHENADAMKIKSLPIQTLKFINQPVTWCDIILKIFNPLLMTQQMKNQLLHARTENVGALFDALRIDFNDRYEIAYTEVREAQVAREDKHILQSLGAKFPRHPA